MSKKVQDRKWFMSAADQAKMGNLPRTHKNMKEYTGYCRTGKTAKDRAMKGM